MFAQGGLCFFCEASLPKAEASVEHLVPSARAGSNSDDNCVACCKAVNALFGSMSLKEKIRVVLNQKGKFRCPNGAGSPSVTSKGSAAVTKAAPAHAAKPTPKVDAYSVALADLVKRGASRPRRADTLRNTIRTAVKNSGGTISDLQLETVIKHLQANGKLLIEGAKVSYSL